MAADYCSDWHSMFLDPPTSSTFRLAQRLLGDSIRTSALVLIVAESTGCIACDFRMPYAAKWISKQLEIIDLGDLRSTILSEEVGFGRRTYRSNSFLRQASI